MTPMPEKILRHFPRTRESILSVIPAKAGIHNSRARGNSTKRNTIQTNQTHHSHTELPSTSFPRTRESTPSSVIPADAGIHPIIRHSRLRGNDRVFFRALGSWDDEFPRARELWISAFAGMTEYFFRHWGNRTMNSRVRGNCGFPPSRE